MFGVQMESDVVPASSIVGKKSTEERNASNSSPMRNIDAAVSVASQLKTGRSFTVGQKSKASRSSHMSEGFSVGRRAASQLRGLWNQSDFAVCRIIAVLAKSRM